MKPNEVQPALQRQGLGPLFLVVGEEDYLRDQVLEVIRNFAVKKELESNHDESGSFLPGEFSSEVVYGDDTDAQDILSRVEAKTFFAKHQLVVLRWAEKLSTRDGEALIPYFQSPNPDTTLVMSASKLDGRLKWVQVVKKQSIVVDCAPLYENQRMAWVRNEASRSGIRLDPEAAQMLKECAGEGLYRARSELDKLALYAEPNKTVNDRDIQAVQGKDPGLSVFELSEAIAQGQASDALLIFEKNLEAGEAPLRILGALVWQYRKLWKAQECLTQGKPESVAAREGGIPPFRQQEFFAIVKRFPSRHFRKAFELFAQVDGALKGGEAGSPRRILGGLLVTLCLDIPVSQKMGPGRQGQKGYSMRRPLPN